MSDEKSEVLVVDDAPENIFMVTELLKDKYKIRVATNGKMALDIATAHPPDIILLDVVMPVMDGFETCMRLKKINELSDVPVIFLTSSNDVEDENRGFELGAVDFIVKPINPPTLLARLHTQLALKLSRDFLRDKNNYLEQEVTRRTQEIAFSQEISIMAMAALAETRDNETGKHILRTKLYIKILAEKHAENPKYKDILDKDAIYWITTSAPLHDIGKVGIPDHILKKPAKLTDEEFDIMKSHTTIGREAIERAESMVDGRATFLIAAKEIVYSHHEKWNGSGYPLGLKGDDIPISARLMALADSYDAICAKRVYKDAIDHEKATEIIIKDSGSHFDPDIVETFLLIKDKFKEISEQYKDDF